MKKVLALVLAVIMVCTMAMAVDVTTTTTPSGTSAEPAMLLLNLVLPLEVSLQAESDRRHPLLSEIRTANLFLQITLLAVTFAKGDELVASQGWVKTTVNGDTD